MNFFNNKNRVGSSLLLLFSLVYLNASFDIPLNPVLGNEVFTARTLPVALSVMAIVVSLIHLFMPVRHSNEESIQHAIKGFQWQPFLLLTVLMLFYGLTFNFFGFAIGTVVFLFIGFSILGERRYWLSAIVSVAIVAFMWVVLVNVFEIYLDSGSLYRIVGGGV